MRTGRWVGIAALVAALCLLIPASALATPVRISARAKGGLRPSAVREAAIAGAVPLESSPVSGSLDSTLAPDDVYSIGLEPGDGLTVSVTADAGTDFDCWYIRV